MRLIWWLPALLLFVTTGCASPPQTVRFATFNSALSQPQPGGLLEKLRTPDDTQAKAVAQIIQAARPDVLLLQEFDHGPGYDENGEALKLLQQNYLAQPQAGGLQGIQYEHVYLAPSNTGVPTGVDLNGDGIIAPAPGAEIGTDAYAADAHGWGTFPGQYAFVILSKYPIDREGIRTFQELLWKDLPGNQMPANYYSDEAQAVLRLSSKNHVDVPIKVGGETIHVLATHPTPPVFDGPEDRNGRRNYDEIRFVQRYASTDQPFPNLSPQTIRTLAVEDDAGVFGGLLLDDDALPRFVIIGDLNRDPINGERFTPQHGGDPIVGLTSLLGIDTCGDFASSKGAEQAAQRQGGASWTEAQRASARYDTADWADEPVGTAPGNLGVDYVLPDFSPNSGLSYVASGVFWPTADEPLMGVSLERVERASDHRLVWVDVRVK